MEEEADETAYWLELVERMALASAASLKPLRQEADEITAMVVASIKTSKASHPR